MAIFEEKVREGECGDARPAMSPDCGVAVVLLAETEMSSVASLSHAAVVDQPEVDVNLVSAGPPERENAFSHHCIILF